MRIKRCAVWFCFAVSAADPAGAGGKSARAQLAEQGVATDKAESDAGSKRSRRKQKVDEWYFCAQKPGLEKLVRTGPFPDEMSCNEARGGQIASGDQAGVCMPAGQIYCRGP
jgi:hypothetical protein